MADNTYERVLSLRPATNIHDDVPTWAWEYDGKGRIALGTLAIYAGRPGAGKSTRARQDAANYSRGTVAGCWLGQPQNVAWIGSEESVTYIGKPGLRAAGADMSRIYFPEVTLDGQAVRFLSAHDMDELASLLVAHKITVVVVDPLMSTIGSKTDINRNNEVRNLVEPWAQLAEKINGIVIGVAHLNKSGNGDVVAGINGSSAFGEVARAVFGFAKDPDSDDGDRIMSQEKNSIGDEDLAITYRIEPVTVTTDSGRSAEVGRFVLVGNSDRTVGDVLRSAGMAPPKSSQDHDEIDSWLRSMLSCGPVLASEIFTAADAAGYSKDKAKRSKSRIGAEASRPVNPGPWWWSIPTSETEDRPSSSVREPDLTALRAGSRERAGSTTPESLLPAPCEVRAGFQGAGSRAQECGENPRSVPTPLAAMRQHHSVNPPRKRRRTRAGRPVDTTGREAS
ncbi:AAA family ATPase [Jongsikchunia kroppenstedtii]|uniref:AAA family ATPase n=1 Tax=Jongsikchunia kroppenstedtii TaxID=1121721 RepID=UPI00036F6D2D|nr:AAA family ATPase [Jongsikchunia kroppenstedtii]